jgi:hypothetical protein
MTFTITPSHLGHRACRGLRPPIRAIGIVVAMAIMTCPLAGHAATRDDSAPSTTAAYRCPDAKGHIGYSQLPCAGGTELGDLSDHRSAAQRRHAAEAQARDEALLRRMGRERRHQEKRAAEQGAAHLGPRPQVGAKASEASVDAHAPVPLRHCRPPRCFTARAPKSSS